MDQDSKSEITEPSSVFQTVRHMVKLKCGPLTYIRSNIHNEKFVSMIASPDFVPTVEKLAMEPQIFNMHAVESGHTQDPRRMELRTQEIKKFAELVEEVREHPSFDAYRKLLHRQPENKGMHRIYFEQIIDQLNEHER